MEEADDVPSQESKRRGRYKRQYQLSRDDIPEEGESMKVRILTQTGDAAHINIPLACSDVPHSCDVEPGRPSLYPI